MAFANALLQAAHVGVTPPLPPAEQVVPGESSGTKSPASHRSRDGKVSLGPPGSRGGGVQGCDQAGSCLLQGLSLFGI